MSIMSILWIVVWWFLILILLLYAFVWIFSFPFFLVGLFFRIIFFPVQIIDTIFYPVWTLPYLIILWFLAYIVIDLVLHFMKHFTSFKNH